MSSVYLVPLRDLSAFKIGKADRPQDRFLQLSEFYEFDFSKGFTVRCDSSDSAFQIESMLHAACSPHQVLFDYDGGTEFFCHSVYEQALEILKLVAKLRGYEIAPCTMLLEQMPLLSVVKPDDVRKALSVLIRKIRNQRILRNLTQIQLAEAAGISEKCLRNLESGSGCSECNRCFTILKVNNRKDNESDFLVERRVN
jgi:DNA-binding XRE family transcriptional regulator